MRMSELVKLSGMPLATIKYYLREGLLMPGIATSATQADYAEHHLQRLRLIKALIDLAGLSVHGTKTVLDLIDEPNGNIYDTLGAAVGALPVAVEPDPHATYPKAHQAIDDLGQVWDRDFPAVAQLERALEAAELAGLHMDSERLKVYGKLIMAIAEYDLAQMPHSSTQKSIEYAVLGTALFEPVIAAMRRLAHQDLTYRMLESEKNPKRGDR